MEFRERLRSARKKAGFTVDIAAERLGITPGAVRHHENGEREPDLSTVAQYAVMYRVTADWLLRGVGPGPGEPASEVIATFNRVPENRQDQALDVLKTFARKE